MTLNVEPNAKPPAVIKKPFGVGIIAAAWPIVVATSAITGKMPLFLIFPVHSSSWARCEREPNISW